MIRELIYMESPIAQRHEPAPLPNAMPAHKQKKKNDPVYIEHVIKSVLHATGQKIEKIKSKNRQTEIVHARQLLFYFLYHSTGLPLRVIGEMIGDRDHTTVVHGRDKIKDLLHVGDDIVTHDVNRIKEMILRCS